MKKKREKRNQLALGKAFKINPGAGFSPTGEAVKAAAFTGKTKSFFFPLSLPT